MSDDDDCRDFEKKIGNAFVEFRAKCGELNLLNAECLAAEKERGRLYDIYNEKYHAYQDYQNTVVAPLSSQLIELRSGIQALQAALLDTMIEHMLGPRHPHERGEKHDDS